MRRNWNEQEMGRKTKDQEDGIEDGVHHMREIIGRKFEKEINWKQDNADGSLSDQRVIARKWSQIGLFTEQSNNTCWCDLLKIHNQLKTVNQAKLRSETPSDKLAINARNVWLFQLRFRKKF